MQKTTISWTDLTINLLVGCTEAGEDCNNCYARKMAWRLKHSKNAVIKSVYGDLTEKVDDMVMWTGQIFYREDLLEEVHKRLSNLAPSYIFMNSMSDWFHPNVKHEWLDQLFELMGEFPKHTFQVLTKRPARMANYAKFPGNTIPGNVMLGVSVGNQITANARIPYLHLMPYGITTFVSYEPAIGPIKWEPMWKNYFDQIIVGGESGGNRRPFDMQWARDTRDFCLQHHIAFFFKQDGAAKSGKRDYVVNQDGTCWRWHQFPNQLTIPEQVFCER